MKQLKIYRKGRLFVIHLPVPMTISLQRIYERIGGQKTKRNKSEKEGEDCFKQAGT